MKLHIVQDLDGNIHISDKPIPLGYGHVRSAEHTFNGKREVFIYFEETELTIGAPKKSG